MKNLVRTSLKTRFVINIAVMMAAFFALLAGGSATLGIMRINEQMSEHLHSVARSKLEQIDLRVSYLLESINNFASSSLAINRLIDATGGTSYFSEAIHDLARAKEVRSVVAFDFSGRSFQEQGDDTEWFSRSVVAQSLSQGKVELLLLSDRSSLVVVQPISYYNTPQGGIAVEFGFREVLADIATEDEHGYILYVGDDLVVPMTTASGDTISVVVDSTMNSPLHQFDVRLEALVSKNMLRAPVISSLIEISMLGIIGLLISLLVARRVGGRLATPILQLAQRVREGAHPCGPVGTGDELEALASSFDHKAEKLIEARNLLEQRVAERTAQLQEQTETMQQRSMELESAHEALEVAHEDLKVLDHMKDEFISTVSHELRTPLTSIRGALGLVVGGATEGRLKEQKHLLETALANSERLSRLINDLLDFQKLSSGMFQLERKNIELKDFLESIVEEAKGYASKYHVFVEYRDEDGDGLVVHADAHRIRQVMDNLVSNAIKYSPKGGTVTISTEKKNKRVRISVRDHGVGIPLDFRDKIFTKFSQADASDTRAKDGTGLGLSICKGIIDAHRGRIGYDDAPGGGTIFWIELPRPLRVV